MRWLGPRGIGFRGKVEVQVARGSGKGCRRVKCSASGDTAIVVGAGVIGLCTAVRLQESGYSVKCLAENIGGDPNQGVASGGAGGLWFPYLCESTERTGRWANETRRAYEDILSNGTKFEENGVAVKDIWQCYSPADEIPPWAGDCPTFELLTKSQVEEKYYPHKPQYEIMENDFLAYQFQAPIVQVDIYLSYLRRLFTSMGGELVQHRVDGPIEALEADVLVNCAGIGNATHLQGLEQDALMKPVRGQIIHCKNREHITEAVTIGGDGESAYMIPRGDVIVYGGTSDENQWDLDVDQDAVQDIIRRCKKLLPEAYTRDMEVVGHWVGLRPYREQGVSVEARSLEDGRVVVNNYGHGGSGFTLCYGCADEVVRLASERNA
ncbi:D-amino acid oxidase [Chloropicon primus]|uniref:D-amino acid oxidase n=2 Tax=Chloropicon primus TaxID=1764295 RepID=A0A5B8MSN5_9CHLO|nr:D-amino acid oxidase [Chloropicon primus]UPR01599.1 D-amino acid oxidase [Chloropicon primus]|eukprot:QDZ22382.1 D-amino acid oxidase [Chloropicon primus]